ncbi:MAG: hypothetical protein V2A65_11240 [Candidatus Omnitrophota bacterium]
MKNKNFEVKIYYTGLCTHQVKAKTKDEAINKARKIPINKNEIFSNLENWKEADNAEELKKNEE